MAGVLGKWHAIRSALEALAAHHRVPGASLAVMDGDVVVEAATGVANVNTGVDVTPDTLFQIGSNTKLYTATLVMQLVDRGQVDLDAPVRQYIDDFRLGQADAADCVTVRHLLTHSSGIEGDYFEDFGRGDDCIEQYVASLSQIGQVHPPGERFSYCNTGFTVAGHLVQRMTGRPYHEVLSKRLLEPLGLRETTVLLEEMVGFRYAAGHTVDARGKVSVVPQIMMARASAPAGSVTSATARDVLRFVAMHLDGGRAPNGAAVLSSQSVAAMQQPQYPIPGSASGRSQVGLAWLMDEWDGVRVIGHGGATLGQLSFLEVLPDRRFAVCLLTNAGTGNLLWRDLGSYVFQELAGVQMPRVPEPPESPPPVDLAAYEGVYKRLSERYELTVEGSTLILTTVPTGPLADLVDAEPERWRLLPIDRERFYVRTATGWETLVTFSDFDRAGRPGYLFMGRATPRVRDGAEGP
jgi:CubicO group peptidase (beta-lactamase class C family)